jgi:hypothetical protein
MELHDTVTVSAEVTRRRTGNVSHRNPASLPCRSKSNRLVFRVEVARYDVTANYQAVKGA